MENLIKLKMTEQAQAENKSQVVTNTFVEACLNLDTSIFEPLIEEDQLFQDLDKYRFLQTMKNIFDYMKAQKIKKMEFWNPITKMVF